MESLNLELAQFNIKTTLIEPGFFRTDFLDASSVQYGSQPINDYAESSSQAKAALEAHNHQQAGDPAKLGPALLALAAAKTPPVRFSAGSDSLQALLNKSESLRTEAEHWRELSTSTDGNWN